MIATPRLVKRCKRMGICRRMLVTLMLVSLILFALLFLVSIGYALYFGHNSSIIASTALPSGSYMSAQIAATEKGSVYVVWVDRNQVFSASSQDNGTKFSTPMRLSDGNKLSSSPQIAATEKGGVYIVWVDINSTSKESTVIVRSSNDSGRSFNNAKQFHGGDIPSSSPQIAATEKGNVYVVWVDKNQVFSASSQDNGTKFSTPMLLSDGNKLSSSPQIAATEKGGVYVVWVENATSADTNIKFRSSSDYGLNFDDDKRLSPKNDISSSWPQIAATEKGYVYILRVDRNRNDTNGSGDVIVRVSTNGGANFSRGVFLNDIQSEIPLSSQQLIALEKGTAYVIWSDSNVEFKEILGVGDILGRTVLLSSNFTVSSSPQIAATEGGNVYVVWMDKNSSGVNDLKLKRLNELFIN